MAKEKKTGGVKKLSLYNTFMRTELARVKLEDTKLTHKDAFKLAAKNWATSPENPKNKIA